MRVFEGIKRWTPGPIRNFLRKTKLHNHTVRVFEIGMDLSAICIACHSALHWQPFMGELGWQNSSVICALLCAFYEGLKV